MSFNGKSYPWHIWGTVITPGKETESWGIYEDQFYQGKSAILHRKVNNGSSTYIGAWSDDWTLEYALLRHLYGKVLGELPFYLPPYVFVHYRQGLWFAVNYTDQEVDIPLSKDATLLSGRRKLPPAGVLTWRK